MMNRELLQQKMSRVTAVLFIAVVMFFSVQSVDAATYCSNNWQQDDECYDSLTACQSAGERNCQAYTGTVFCQVEDPSSCWDDIDNCDGILGKIACVAGANIGAARAGATQAAVNQSAVAAVAPNSYSQGFKYEPLEDTFIPKEKADLPVFLKYIFNVGISIVGLSALVMITIGGITYVGSAGNNATAESAKKMIRDALLGVALAFFSWIILYVINPDLVGIGENLEKLTVAGSQYNPHSNLTATGGAGSNVKGSYNGSGYDSAEEQRIRGALSHAPGGGVSINRQNACTSPTDTGCTSVAGLPQNAVDAIIDMKTQCGTACVVRVNGGSEQGGHATHGPGAPVFDIDKNSTLDNFFKNNYTKGAPVSGNPCYNRPGGGAVWFEDSAHYHVDLRVSCGEGFARYQ